MVTDGLSERRGALEADQAEARALADRIGAARRAQLCIDRGYVELDGMLAYAQLPRDQLVRKALADEA